MCQMFVVFRIHLCILQVISVQLHQSCPIKWPVFVDLIVSWDLPLLRRALLDSMGQISI